MKAVEITTCTEGGPVGVRRGYIGFRDFAEAETFPEQYNGVIVTLRKKKGWRQWECEGPAARPFSFSGDIIGVAAMSCSIDMWQFEIGVEIGSR